MTFVEKKNIYIYIYNQQTNKQPTSNKMIRDGYKWVFKQKHIYLSERAKKYQNL